MCRAGLQRACPFGPLVAQLPTVALQRGSGIAALFNGHARQVTPKVVRAFREALPGSLVLVCNDLAQLRRQAKQLCEARPQVVFCGGGDGTATVLFNALREIAGTVPPLALLRLGTGNAWARTLGAKPFNKTLPLLARAQLPLPTRHHPLVEIEGIACPFAGVGWDAHLLNDYQRQRDRASERLFISPFQRWMHSGLTGYLYSAARYTVPGEWSSGLLHAAVTGTLRASGGTVLYEGAVDIAGFSTITEYGFGFRAFPNAQSVPGQLNVRIYGGPLSRVLRNVPRLWRGTTELEGLTDVFVDQARFEFSRPVAFQIAGDPRGERQALDISISKSAAEVVDWAAVERQ